MPRGRKTKAADGEEDVASPAPKRVKKALLQRQAPDTKAMVLTLGQGDTGQLGLGDDIMERARPAIVKGLQDISVSQVVCGGMHTVALTTEGTVYTFGCNDEGALGRSGDETVPAQVELDAKVVQVSAGDSHTAMITRDGALLVCGNFKDSNGPIGLLPNGSKCERPQALVPSKAVRVASGADHIAVVLEDGNLLTFGVGEQGQLGRVQPCFLPRGGRRGLGLLVQPAVVHFSKRQVRVTDVACGGYHTFAVVNDGQTVYSFGLNNYGQLGLGNTELQYTPHLMKKYSELSHIGAPKFAAGLHHSLMLLDGNVYTFGRADYGRLGLGAVKEDVALEPMQIPDLSGVVAISAGTAVSICCDEDGVGRTWGMGTNLQLAGEGEDDVDAPSSMRGKQLEERKVVGVAAGGQHTALLVQNK